MYSLLCQSILKMNDLGNPHAREKDKIVTKIAHIFAPSAYTEYFNIYRWRLQGQRTTTLDFSERVYFHLDKAKDSTATT